MYPYYRIWTFHGETRELHSKRIRVNVDQNIGQEQGISEMLNDLTNKRYTKSNEEGQSVRGESSDHNRQAQNTKFQSMLNELDQELYPGCMKFSVITFMVKLLHIKVLKVLNLWSNKSFDMLLQLLKEALPNDCKIPESYYGAKKMLCDLGLGYEKIHACKNDCIIFWKDNEQADVCPQCNEPRYKTDKGNGIQIPHKVLRHFPLIPRLQRLYLSKHTSNEMRWHKERRLDVEGVLRHQADGEAWKEFDKQYSWFARDSRNVRLTLVTDGFNPFGNMNVSYSTWPVILIPYNLPPWKCMKESFWFMSLLIPGPKAPGKDIDVYLQPLINELKELWSTGVDTYDVCSSQNFRLHAALMWTINDFPAYGDLSGWSMKG
ncbi:uncharacterized protein LOC111018268 [Momordica charantia]|uniref:Uncharacterized protein LOC111018268 n=1 Tax=Momordica charantia TaxID=3673 RepID=A0A6J1DA33_MOMCH|nr:uncharacterized protein LOC111018268 [Momordica charantia]